MQATSWYDWGSPIGLGFTLVVASSVSGSYIMKHSRFIFLIGACLPVILLSSENTWVNPKQKNVRTVFYQGMFSSQTQGAKYTGSHGFIATTGEQVINQEGLDVIQHLYVKPEIDEIIPASTKPFRFSDISLHPKVIFYGLCSRFAHVASRYAHRSYGTLIEGEPAGNQTIAAHAIDLSKINVAQQGDLENHRRRFESCRKEFPEDDVITYGVSRGAATTFQSLALSNKENNRDLAAIKLCILEGCFDSVPNIMKKRYPRLFNSPLIENFLMALASWVTSFKKDGPAPIKIVDYFPQHIPVAFITSKKDKEVPAESTRNLAQALARAGHQHVYLLELKNSSHPRYMFDDASDTQLYKHFIHALYAHSNLPHIQSYALKGAELVERCKVP